MKCLIRVLFPGSGCNIPKAYSLRALVLNHLGEVVVLILEGINPLTPAKMNQEIDSAITETLPLEKHDVLQGSSLKKTLEGCSSVLNQNARHCVMMEEGEVDAPSCNLL